jgi:hypothetical protein
VKARDKKQNKNQAWNPTYPIGLSSTIDPVPRGKVLPHLPQGLEARCVNDSFQYLGMQTGRRNEAAGAKIGRKPARTRHQERNPLL